MSERQDENSIQQESILTVAQRIIISQTCIYQCIKFLELLSISIKMRQIDEVLMEQIQMILMECLPSYTTGELKIEKLCGMTNEIFKISFCDRKPIVFRNLSPIINRKVEGDLFLFLSRKHIVPKCYYTSLDHRVQQYIESAYHPSCLDILCNPQILKPIIKKMSDVHKIEITDSIPKNILIQDIFASQNKKKYLQLAPNVVESSKQFYELKQRIMNQYEPRKEWFIKNFNEKSHRICFCHNDLNPLNILIQDVAQHQKQVIFIDFQYASLNYAAYDIANFMNQTCFIYGQMDFGFKVVNLITARDIEQFCSHYDLRYEGIEKDIGKMLILTNYYWALWSLQAKATPSHPNFEPLKHGNERMDLVDYYILKFDN